MIFNSFPTISTIHTPWLIQFYRAAASASFTDKENRNHKRERFGVTGKCGTGIVLDEFVSMEFGLRG
ncbi:hypothetical protein DITRI_Ditri12bG0113300 [Diplodiscus trichospermus]